MIIVCKKNSVITTQVDGQMVCLRLICQEGVSFQSSNSTEFNRIQQMSIQLLNASLRNDKTVMKDSVNLVFQKHYAHVGVLLLSCFHKTITRLAMATPSSQCDLEERRKKLSQNL